MDASMTLPLLDADGQPRVTDSGEAYPRCESVEQGQELGGWFDVLPGLGPNHIICRMTSSQPSYHPAGHNQCYCQFNPYTQAGRMFLSDMSADPASWVFNTYNRMRVWMKIAVGGAQSFDDIASIANGYKANNFGVYVKRRTNPNWNADESATAAYPEGGHFYHDTFVPGSGLWTQIMLNSHPPQSRGSGSRELGNQPHPCFVDDTNTTLETDFNWWDNFTRFYFSNLYYYPDASLLTGDNVLDYEFRDIEVYQEQFPENDDQVSTLAATYDPVQGRVLLTWSRRWDEPNVAHEVRYSFDEPHVVGWAACQAPDDGGIVQPAEYPGMIYMLKSVPLAGRDKIYLAVKPQNASLFSRIEVPLNLS